MGTDDVSPERIGQYYDEWTGRYMAAFGDTIQACRPTELADLHRYVAERARLRDGQRVLDAGCGVCGPSLFFAKYRDVLIDALTVSLRQVEIAGQLIARAGLGDRIRVRLGDYHRLHDDYPPDTFDRVLFLESLSHAPDPAGPLRSAFRVLKPGGAVYIKDFFARPCDSEPERRCVRDVVARVDRTFLVRTPVLTRTIRALEGAGFREELVEPVRFVLDDGVWQRFDDAHRFDIYDGGAPFAWSEWAELRFRKPGDGRTAPGQE